MTKVGFLRFWSIAVGAMDGLTGLLLIFVPGFVLGMLKITVPAPDAMVFLSWIGVFVLSVGLSYGLALGTRGRGEAIWIFTSFVRMMVAVFLTAMVMQGTLQAAWIVVAVSDAAVALAQVLLLRAGWWKEVRR